MNDIKIYGAYGSNMNVEQMANRCPNAKVIGTGHIANHRLTFRASGVANVERNRNTKVPVVIWEITKKCEKALDRYEGFPFYYEKRNIKVQTDDGKTITAMFYVMAKQYEDTPAIPSQYYARTILDGYRQNKIGIRPFQEALKYNLKEVNNIE